MTSTQQTLSGGLGRGARRPIPTGAFSHQTGQARGEELTLQVLEPLHRRGAVLGLLRGAPTPSGIGVDLVLTTGGPLATHSVWHEHGLHSPEVRELAAEAHDDARAARELLRSVGSDLPVLPVVVVWGPDEGAVEAGARTRHQAVFVRGSELESWLAGDLAEEHRLTAGHVEDLVGRLRGERLC